ncbi:hypothetical protein FOMPIDRAFT_1046235 [Fomitopsis schrenkii]|uniref:Uncharacterized protein n=1 Tax=Fomitopsis schrenkii TaxID=2126942 RepID=S8FT14_FOMSC|nr:hypothetical protein FOMPIDRAFT_1046235 [Fomitopsis schrenkii]
MTTPIFFFIFAAHEDIYSVWWQWIRRCLPRWKCAPHPYDDTSSSSQGYQKASTLRGPLRIFDWLSHHRARPGGEDEDAEQCACDSAIALSKSRTSKRWDEAATGTRTPRMFTRHIMQISYAAPFTPSNDPRGLPPPPRHQRSRSHSPSEPPPVFRAAPSLSAIGPKRSRRAVSESRRHPSRRQFLDHPPAQSQPRAGDHADAERRSWKTLRLTPSDEGERSKDEATSKIEEVVTQFSVVSAGETFDSRSRSRAGGTVDGLDLTGTFGVIAPD